ncbi:hypothetical protein QM480_15600 [Flectobacillus sp. DC10W]|uniref:Uncharacterized protein n=1 Tax=Flectobacillus longus TaxID=2984207 RepID=A0ABT6YQA6_9BACT|nr:hypothetical protein [Flectobacillus longus]MDI9865769.1 hypothetical protein [Flectobacillus longus]
MMNVSTIVRFWKDFLWIESREKWVLAMKPAPAWDKKPFHFNNSVTNQ